MQKLLLSFLLIPTIAFSQAPTNYYDGTTGLTGYQLKSKVHSIISAKTITWHYGDLPNFYGQTDIDHHYDFDSSNSTYLLDIYSNNPSGKTAYYYTKDNLISSAASEGLGYNREHMMPQSSFNSAYPMYSDLFFVVPTDARINQRRSNYPYGVAGSTNYYTFTNGSKISNNATPSSGYTGRVYEPINEFKGDIARSLLYYAVRYEGKLSSFNYYNGSSAANDTNPLDGTEEKAFEDWYIAMLLKWHNQDPVSAREIERNNIVYSIQKNRNPFIDHPEWVEKIWVQSAAVVAPATPANLQADQTSAFFTKLSWQPSSSTSVIGYKIFQNNVLVGYTSENTFLVDHLSPSTAYQFTVKAYDNTYAESDSSNQLSINTLDDDLFSEDLLITKYLEGTDSNHAIEITNRTGHTVDLNSYKLSIQYYNSGSGSYYFPAPYELEGTVKNNESFVVLNPYANFSCITNEEAKFVSAAPQMTFNGTNYLELRYNNTTVDAIGIKYSDNSASLQDVSLYRNESVENPNSTFNLSEWTAYSTDYCDQLGMLAVAENANSTKSSFVIYPNPVQNTLFLKGKLGNNANAKIFDVTGKILLNVNISNANSIDVHQLGSGVYLLQIGGETQKFIKN